MKKVSLFVFVSLVVFAATAQKTNTPSKTAVVKTEPSTLMKNLLDSFSYAAGMNVANNMKEQGITEVNTAMMYKALQDLFNNKPPALSADDASKAMQKHLEVLAKIKADAEDVKDKAFLEENKKNKDVVTLPSGIQYTVITQNDSITNKPKAYDTVVVNYIAKLIDGKEFYNSYSKGEASVFVVNGMIRGWTEILQMMPVGAKWKVVIPSDLAYGLAGAGNGVIPPNAVLIFEISLEGIKPGKDPNAAK